ncbi:MAG: Tad domain-containing protein [Sedimentibacter sp.]|uniref:Tad domain-containing protein n=1 Tax=Sedimentibacter sp. TaxID=1960295 RepID=UPI0031599195
MKKILEHLKNESGQALVLLAFAFAVLIGFSALAVDVGYMTVQKGALQKAADAAALSGALSLSKTNSVTDIEKAVKSYIEANPNYNKSASIVINEVTPNWKNGTVYVNIEQKAPKFLSRIITPDSVTLKAEAEAGIWSGGALPFVNLDDHYPDPMDPRFDMAGEDDPDFDGDKTVYAWNSAGRGDYERLLESDAPYSPDYTSCYVNYKDGGITVEKGTDINFKLKEYMSHIVVGSDEQQSYVFSLSNQAIKKADEAAKAVKDKLEIPDDCKEYQYLNEIKNTMEIPLRHLVILNVNIENKEFKASKRVLELKVEKVYYYDSSKADFFDASYNRPFANAGGTALATLVK